MLFTNYLEWNRNNDNDITTYLYEDLDIFSFCDFMYQQQQKYRMLIIIDD